MALDGVVDYLPSPIEKSNYGFQLNAAKEEVKIEFKADTKEPFVGYVFKLEENKFG